MKMNLEVIYLNATMKPDFNDREKYVPWVLLMQDTETLECKVDEALYNGFIASLDKYTPIDCTLAYNPKYKSIKLVSADIAA